MVTSFIGLIFSIIWLLSFNNYVISEVEFSNNQITAAKEQHQIFIPMQSIIMIIFVLTSITSIIGLIWIFREKNNSYLILKINTYVSISLLLLILTLLSIQPQSISSFVTSENGFIYEETLPQAQYVFGYLNLIFTIIIFIGSGLSRRNYGFVKKNSFLL